MKVGAGSLLLSVANNFSGGTTVNDGTLEIGASATAGTSNIVVMPINSSTGALLQLDSATTVLSTQSLTFQDNGSTSALATVNLNYSGTDTIFALNYDGSSLPNGTYGAPGSGANNTESFISGSGFLMVTPEPAAASTLVLGGGLLLRKRRSTRVDRLKT